MENLLKKEEPKKGRKSKGDNIGLALVIVLVVVLAGFFLYNRRTELTFALTNGSDVLMIREARMKKDSDTAKKNTEDLKDSLAQWIVNSDIVSPLPSIK